MLAALAFVPGAGAQSFGPQGAEFHVNSHTTDVQGYPSVAMSADGDFMVVWHSRGQDAAGGYGVFGQRFDAAGSPAGAEFQVNAYTTSNQRNPAVAAAGAGRFIVVWEGDLQDGSSRGVFGQRYDATGAPLGATFRANSFTTGAQEQPAVAADSAGNFLVVWVSPGQDGSAHGIFGQVYDAAGNRFGAEFQVNTYTTGGQLAPAVATTGTGRFVVVWQSDDQDGDDRGVFGQRYDEAGNRQGAEFRANTYTTRGQNNPAVAVDPAGRFMIAWEGSQVDGSYGILAQRYDAAGTPQGGEFPVNTFTTAAQTRPAIAAGASGDWLVAWRSFGGQDLSSTAAVGRRFDAAGLALGDEFVVNTYTTQSQSNPAVAADPSGRFVVAWHSLYQEGGAAASYGIFGQRFAPADLIFADGFESGDLTAWSGSSTGGGELTVSGAAALNGSANGLQGVVNDTAGLYVQDDSPADENRFRARFYFDTNGFDPGEAQLHRRTRLFVAFEELPTRRLIAVVLRRLNGQYSLMGRARRDDNGQDDTSFFDILPGEHYVELDWRRATEPAANDGSFQLWLDGALVSTRTGLDNSLSTVDFVRLGALSVKLAANGTLFWDEFESRRFSAIGP